MSLRAKIGVLAFFCVIACSIVGSTLVIASSLFALGAGAPSSISAKSLSPDGTIEAVSYWNGRGNGSGSYYVAVVPKGQPVKPNGDADVFEVLALNLEPGQKDIFDVKWTNANHLLIHIGSGSVLRREKAISVLGHEVTISIIVDKER